MKNMSVVAIVLVTALAVSHSAFAGQVTTPPGAPEMDPAMAIAGLGLAGGAAALIWERLRSRKNKKP